MNDHTVLWSMCPHCGALQEGAANITGTDAPEAGDITMCFDCGGWAEFEENGQRHKLTDTNKLEDPEVQRMIAVYWQVRSMHPERWKR